MNFLSRRVLLALVPAMVISGAAWAQAAIDAWPSRPVTIVIPYSPGSATESEVRIYAQKLAEILGQPFQVDFKPGGGSTIGTAHVAKAVPDGYTLLQVSSAFIVASLLYRNLPYDATRDFAPISLMSKKPNVLLVSPSFQAKSLSDYIAYARANPGKINFATSGAGGPQHLVGAMLHSATNTRVTFIHYKGGAPGVPDLLAGRVDVLVNPLAMSLSFMQTGKMRALAILSLERTPLSPDTATVSEQEASLSDFEYSAVIGILAPRQVPVALINKIGANFARTAKSPDVAQKLATGGSVMLGTTPEQYRQHIATETERWRKVIRENDIRLEE